MKVEQQVVQAMADPARIAMKLGDGGVSYSLEVVSDVEDMERRSDDWDDLATNAIEANAFYESWMLLPAVRSFSSRGGTLAFVFVHEYADGQKGKLVGFFPFQRRRRYRRVPFQHLALWDYGACFLSTPLIRRGYAMPTFEALWQWIHSGHTRDRGIEMRWVPGDRAFGQALSDFHNEHEPLSFQSAQFTRAYFRCKPSADDYLEHAVSPGKRRDLARKERRLKELGELSYDELQSPADSARWIEEFLQLESSGWKGRAGSALAKKSDHSAFFRAMAKEGVQRGRVWFSAMRLDGRAIAMRCNYLSPPGSFFFKPAYDESFSRYSPGVLLEVETIRRLHEMPDIQWMDSCTSPDNELLNRLWLDRRIIQTTLWVSGEGLGAFVIASQVAARWWKRWGAKPPPMAHGV